jgi:hypothetical protein
MNQQDKIDLLRAIMAKHDMRICRSHGLKDGSYRWDFKDHQTAENFSQHLGIWIITAPAALTPGDDGTIFRYEGPNQEILVLDLDRIG